MRRPDLRGLSSYFVGMCVAWQAKQHCERGERGECETCLQQDLAKPKERVCPLPGCGKTTDVGKACWNCKDGKDE